LKEELPISYSLFLFSFFAVFPPEVAMDSNLLFFHFASGKNSAGHPPSLPLRSLSFLYEWINSFLEALRMIEQTQPVFSFLCVRFSFPMAGIGGTVFPPDLEAKLMATVETG